MACVVAIPVLESSRDFPAWLETQGVNAEVARAMDSELGIRDYGVLRACVGDGLVRAELLATARDRLPFGFYAVLRQMVKTLQGADTHDGGTTTQRWDDTVATSSPGDVMPLGGLVDVLLALFSSLSRELLLSVQRIGELDGVKQPTAAMATPYSLEDETNEINRNPSVQNEHAEDGSTLFTSNPQPALTVNHIKTEIFSDSEGEHDLGDHPDLSKNVTSLGSSSRSCASASSGGICPQPQQVLLGEMRGEETAGTSGSMNTEQHSYFQSDKVNVFASHTAKTPAINEGESCDFRLENPNAPTPQPGCVREKPSFSCEVCKRVFSRSNNLQVHLLTHTAKKPFRCEVCGRGFLRTTELKIHLHRHTGEKPYRCQVCGQGFMLPSVLKIHSRTHTGEKPCICQVCGHRCLQPCDLKRHMQMHTGEKPYSCRFCGQCFARSNYMKNHERTRHVLEMSQKLV